MLTAQAPVISVEFYQSIQLGIWYKIQRNKDVHMLEYRSIIPNL